jgi:hypothetical protein
MLQVSFFTKPTCSAVERPPDRRSEKERIRFLQRVPGGEEKSYFGPV